MLLFMGADQDGSVRRVASAALAVALLGACSVNGLAFKQDERVSFVEPGDRDEVEVPLEVRWRATDLPLGTSYAVFVDRAPQPPGKTVAWLFRDDDACERDPSCPNEEFLAVRDIYLTREPRLTIERLRDQQEGTRREFHEITVVLLDAKGRRIGESAFSREVQVVSEDD